jgi:succinyl-CoA synthetase beta subunit
MVVGEVVAAGWCRDAGLVVPAQGLAASAEAAVEVAARIGFPVCVKIAIDDVAHKSDIGGLRLDLGSAGEVVSAYDEVTTRVSVAVPDAVIRGVLVQEMIGEGLELLVSVRRDPAWGVVASIGAGGVRAELSDDIVVLALPSSGDVVRERLARLRLHPLFDGYRDEPAYDLEAVLGVVDHLDRFLQSRPDVVELEVNPLILRPGGAGAVAVDAMARVKVPGGDRGADTAGSPDPR